MGADRGIPFSISRLSGGFDRKKLNRFEVDWEKYNGANFEVETCFERLYLGRA